MHYEVYHVTYFIFQHKKMIFKHIYLKIIEKKQVCHAADFIFQHMVKKNKKNKKLSLLHSGLHFLTEAKFFEISIFENHDNKTKK